MCVLVEREQAAAVEIRRVEPRPDGGRAVRLAHSLRQARLEFHETQLLVAVLVPFCPQVRVVARRVRKRVVPTTNALLEPLVGDLLLVGNLVALE